MQRLNFNQLFALAIWFTSNVEASVALRRGQTALPTGWISVGCYTDNTASRTLKTAATSDVTGMTIGECLAFCTPASYQFAGLEFGRECYCDNVIESTGAPATDGCNMPCTGDSTETCGGSNRISIFNNTAVSHAPPPPAATIKQIVGSFQYKGCFQDAVDGGPRSLLHQLTLSGGVDAEMCTAACKAAGFPLAGLEYGQECWCDTYMPLVIPAPDSDCNMPCQLDATEICGSGNRLAVYQDTTASPPSPTACLNNAQFTSPTVPFRYDLYAVPNPGGGGGMHLGAYELVARSGQPTYFQLSAQIVYINNEAHNFNYASNTFWPDDYFGEGRPIALAPTVNSVQEFAAWSTLRPYSQYCVMPNPVGPFGPFFGPPTLAVNGRNDQWQLCSGPTFPSAMIYQPQTMPNVTCQGAVLAMGPLTPTCYNCGNSP